VSTLIENISVGDLVAFRRNPSQEFRISGIDYKRQVAMYYRRVVPTTLNKYPSPTVELGEVPLNDLIVLEASDRGP
jgi:hypothetical protein